MVKKANADLNTPFFDLVVKLIELKNIPQYVEKINFSHKKIRIEDNILVAGSPRSGTTWLMELLSSIPDYTYIFEPIHPRLFPKSFKIGFRNRTYLPTDKNWAEGEEYLKKVFTGKIPTILPAYGPSPRLAMQRLLAHKFIIKTIRLNRLLPWLTKRFDFKAVFLIIRHPCAVVSSQIKTDIYGYDQEKPPYSIFCPDIEDILDEVSEINLIDKKVIEKLNNLETKEEILTASWCLDTLIPLKYNKTSPWTTIFYEDLVKYREKVITDIFKKIDVEISQKQKTQLINKRSMTAPKTNEKTISNSNKQLSKWKKQLNKKQIEDILDVVSCFGLDFYTEDIEPIYEKLR